MIKICLLIIFTDSSSFLNPNSCSIFAVSITSNEVILESSSSGNLNTSIVVILDSSGDLRTELVSTTSSGVILEVDGVTARHDLVSSPLRMVVMSQVVTAEVVLLDMLVEVGNDSAM